MADWYQDVRESMRQLRRRPIFAAMAILTLAIGMGVNVVAFTLVNGLLFKGFNGSAYPGVGRITMSSLDDPDGNASLAEFERFNEAVGNIADVAAEGRSIVLWTFNGQTEPAWVLYVTPNYFSMVKATVMAGNRSRARPVPIHRTCGCRSLTSTCFRRLAR
jgi:hypothetical protein